MNFFKIIATLIVGFSLMSCSGDRTHAKEAKIQIKNILIYGHNVEFY